MICNGNSETLKVWEPLIFEGMLESLPQLALSIYVIHHHGWNEDGKSIQIARYDKIHFIHEFW